MLQMLYITFLMERFRPLIRLIFILLLVCTFTFSFGKTDTDNEFFFIPKEKEKVIVLTEGLTEDQIHNIKVFSTRALNLILDAFSSLHRRKVILKETYSYIDGALFFLNEAKQYSPSYLVYRQIEALKKRFRFFPNENYTEDLKTLKIYIDEIAGNLNRYDEIVSILDRAIKKAEYLDNSEIYDTLIKLEDIVKIPLIDEPIIDAQNLISIAKDHLKARKYRKARQALELAIEPILKISSRENLYIAQAKEYIHKAYVSYRVDRTFSILYIKNALYAITKALSVSTSENRDMIKAVKNQLLRMKKDFNNEEKILKEFQLLTTQLKNI